MMYSLSIKALGDALIFTIWPLVVKNKDQQKYTSRRFVSFTFTDWLLSVDDYLWSEIYMLTFIN